MQPIQRMLQTMLAFVLCFQFLRIANEMIRKRENLIDCAGSTKFDKNILDISKTWPAKLMEQFCFGHCRRIRTECRIHENIKSERKNNHSNERRNITIFPKAQQIVSTRSRWHTSHSAHHFFESRPVQLLLIQLENMLNGFVLALFAFTSRHCVIVRTRLDPFQNYRTIILLKSTILQ